MISKSIQHILRFFTCQQSNSLCIIVLYNDGSKAPIRLSGLIEITKLQGLKVLPNTNVRPGMFGLGMVLQEIHLGYSTRFLFREQELYLEPGHGRQLYVRKKPSLVDIWGYANACILLFLFIMQTLKFFTLFIFHYFVIYFYVSFLLACDQCFV